MSNSAALCLAVLAACATGTSAPGTAAPGASEAHARVVALISASAEWKIVRAQFASDPVHATAYGEWLVHSIGGEEVVFFHGGYGKVAAAGSTQYAIDHWSPALLVNLGTCGGFGVTRKVGDIILVNDTIIYDIVEMMGDADEAIADYRTKLDVSAWPARLADRVVPGRMVSGDRDLDPVSIDMLRSKYQAEVGDWESGAIAWVAAHNHARLIILRGITDMIDATGNNPTYNALEEWQRRSVAVMASLIALFGEALPDLVAKPR